MESKKKRNDETSAPDLVQIMTISLFIILLAFFILLNSIAVVDEQKKLAVLDSLLGNFGVMIGGESVLEGSGVASSLPKTDALSSYVDFTDLVEGAERLMQLIRVQPDHRGTVLSIPANLLFGKWEAAVTSAGAEVLDRLCGTLRKNGLPVEIIGHTDSRPPMVPGAVSNRELSSLRAAAVLNYLLGKGGFDQNRFTAFGWGEYRPVATNRTRETREMNRRMDIVFVHDKSAEKPKGFVTFKEFFFKILD